MEISVLKDMGLYELLCLIHQLQGVNKAFWAYIGERCIPDPELRAMVDTVSNLVNAEEALLNQAKAAADEFIEAIEKYEPSDSSIEVVEKNIIRRCWHVRTKSVLYKTNK